MRICCCFMLFFCLPFSLLAQKEMVAKYYNAGMSGSIATYDALLNAKAKDPVVYKIYEDQYARHQQRIAVLADKWASGKYDDKKINAALARVANSDITAAVKLMEAALGRKPGAQTDERTRFLAELFELKGDYARAEQLMQGWEYSLEDGLYHGWLLASLGQAEQALAQTALLSQRFAMDTVDLVRIRLQRCFIDTMNKDYTAAQAALVEAQYLLEKVKAHRKQPYWTAIVLGELAQLQHQGNNIDEAYRNAYSGTEFADGINDKELRAWSHGVMARVYKKAGANQQADTQFRASIDLYTGLAATAPQQYQPILADMMNDYTDVLRFFDRHEECMQQLKKVSALRKSLAENKYPFFILRYASSLGRIADQYVFAHSNIDSAEVMCLQQKEILEALYQKYPLLAGPDYSTVLDRLGDINMTLKRYPEGIPYLAQALEIKQKLADVYPEVYKQALMNLLIRNAMANGLYGNNTALAYLQLDKAAALAAGMKDLRVAGEIERIKQRMAQNKN